MFRISVKRTHWHHYNVTVRTKPVPKEPALVENDGITPGAGTYAKKSRRGFVA